MINLNDKILDQLDEKELYLACRIAQHIGKNGVAWPGLNRLVELTGWSKPTVIKIAKQLDGKGVVKMTHRKGENGRNQSNLYRLNTPNIGVFITTDKLGGGSKNSLLGVVKNIDHPSKISLPEVLSNEVLKNRTTPLTPQGERSEDFDVTGTDAPKQQNETETPAPATPRTLDEKAAWLLNYWNKNVRRDKRALTASIYLKGMKARLKDGASGQDCVNVIKDRVLAWYHDDQMNKNVDPVTLFRKANFSRYLDSWHDRTEAERRKVSDITKFIANPPKPGQAQAVAPRPVGKTSADQIAC
jgi:uncharacterized phage protein (TIGR02220 family)